MSVEHVSEEAVSEGDHANATILMYHSINRVPHQTTHTVTPEAFERHLDLIRRHYVVTRLSDLVNDLGGCRPDRRRVAVTFDDGFADFMTFAHPLLQKYAMPCTMFVPTGFIGMSNVLSGDDVQRLHREGLVEFGSHTVDHPSLRQLTVPQMTYQVSESKRALEALLDAQVRLFAYPFGQRCNVSALTRQVIAAAGYEAAVTSSWGTLRVDDDPLSLKRVRLDDHDAELVLKAKIDGEHDWMAVKERVGFLLHSLRAWAS